ncbi:unnamed protein product [Victoria cruziana]
MRVRGRRLRFGTGRRRRVKVRSRSEGEKGREDSGEEKGRENYLLIAVSPIPGRSAAAGGFPVRSSAGGDANREQKRATEGERKRREGEGAFCAPRQKGDRGGARKRARAGAKRGGGGCNTRTSQEVTHPSTTLAQARLTSEF